jgi:hypothetical protein
MGKLDERAFAGIVAACTKCEAKVFEVASIIDRKVSVMLGSPTNEGRWTHDGKNFIDGVYRIQCVRCRSELFNTKDCPRCHRPGGLEAVTNVRSRLAVPMRCPTCGGTQLTVSGFAPAVVRVGEGRAPAPAPTARFGDPGFHVAHIACETCDWVVTVEGCPLCGAPGPLRSRPA